MKQPRLLIVEPDARLAKAYSTALAPLQAADVIFVSSATEALQRLAQDSFDAMLIGDNPPTLDGGELIREVLRLDGSIPIMVLAAQPSVDDATARLKMGAADYLAKTVEPAELVTRVRQMLLGRRLGVERELLRRQIERPYSFDNIIGTSPAMQKVYRTIEQVADSDVDVLVVGDTGTGKELVAQSIHRRSRRAEKPFVPVDCGAIPENLLEGEFFGHERGAFTGADSRRIGLLEFADGGTFFLDEMGELPPLLQAKLLRTLQERKIRRVGGHEELEIDVRIVAATARDLDAMIASGRFRQDLYYRINVVRIDLPPLRERGDDLGLLTEHFATKYSREMGRSLVGITPEAYQVLSHYRWPGNVRELQNVIRRAIALSKDTMIGLDDLPDSLVVAAGQNSNAISGDSTGYFALRDQHLARFERQYLHDLLQRHHGDVKTAAQEACLPRGTLYRLMKNHSLDSTAFRP